MAHDVSFRERTSVRYWMTKETWERRAGQTGQGSGNVLNCGHMALASSLLRNWGRAGRAETTHVLWTMFFGQAPGGL